MRREGGNWKRGNLNIVPKISTVANGKKIRDI